LQDLFDGLTLDLISASGQRIPVLLTALTKTDADGQHLFTRLTFVDDSDRRLHARDMRDAACTADTVRREMRARHAEVEASLLDERENSGLREQFIGVLGHYLRNPLAAIRVGIRLMQKPGGPRSAGRQSRRWSRRPSVVWPG
jgi:sigma-B regulation protein RsbU (phosphoserine phosphatase)